MKVVTLETAKRLKSAGFTQPYQYEPGMVAWFESVNGAVLCSPAESMLSDDIGELIAYAPMATDLIPHGWYLIRNSKDGDPKSEEWTCSEVATPEWFHDDNPAETAAMAWLFVNSK